MLSRARCRDRDERSGRVAHDLRRGYEIAGYTSARNLAQQLHLSGVVALLSQSLAQEENADQRLSQIARSLMSAVKMPAAVE